MRRTAAVAFLIVLAIAGCGGARALIDQPTAAGARAALQQFIADIVAGKGTAACALLMAPVRRGLSSSARRPCAAVLDGALQQPNRGQLIAKMERYMAHVRVTLHGKTATVPNLSGPGIGLLVFSGGSWRVAGGSPR